MGKSTFSIAMFNSELLNYQRVPSGNLAEKLKDQVFTLEHLGHELHGCLVHSYDLHFTGFITKWYNKNILIMIMIHFWFKKTWMF